MTSYVTLPPEIVTQNNVKIMAVGQFIPCDHEFFTYKLSYYSHEDSITSGDPEQVVRSCKRVQNAFLLPLPPPRN
jgi:hypothetical protein